jgi:branched-chain amino acid transport system ATP-binding protein
MSDNILEVIDLSASYGNVEAIRQINFQVKARGIVTVIGANGAGKSTLLNTLMGVLPGRGEIRYDGHVVTRKTVEARVMAGMSLVPERRELFSDMTVRDNLLLGSFRRYKARERGYLDQLDWICSLFPRLQERMPQLAGTLSGGERQMLAIGRALMSKPRLLMLDEPSLGLAPLVVKEILSTIDALRDKGMAILLVEQNARAALRTADYGVVLETGSIKLEGSSADLQRNAAVAEVYLGVAGRSPTPTNTDILQGTS